MTSVASWIERQAARAPGRVAVEFRGEEIDYRQLDRRAAVCAGALSSLGVGPGDRVGVLMGNRPEYVEVFLACARLGAIVVPLPPNLAPNELRFMANDAGLRILVYDGALQETVKSFAPDCDIAQLVVVGEGDGISYESALNSADALDVQAVSSDDVLAIFYTSGTTGLPKGAMLTHDNFFWTNLNMVAALDIQHDERSLVVLPMFHVGGWNVNTFAVWFKGGRVVLAPSFEPARVLELVDAGRITSIMGVPTIFQRLAEHPSFLTTDTSRLRWCICGGAPLPISLIRRYHERDINLTQGYGLTEAAPNCLFLAPEYATAKIGAAGRPYLFVDVQVVGENDEAVPAGGVGEVIVRGPSVMKGYWRRPEDTAAALRGGWLRTGDIGQVDEDGFITIVDRVKDMYISGGENVFPAEVEKALCLHPDVAEAAVIGVPDDRWGETGRAIVVLREGAQADAVSLTSFLSEHLARYKLPTDFTFADSLPRNATGKLLKQDIKKKYGAAR